MSQVIDSLERAQLRSVPHFDAGDRLRVHFQVVEGTRRRTQVFEGTVIKRQGKGARETFTVRKQSFGVGVERTFPVHSPKIELLEIAARGDVRRAKLYYLRGRVGRAARVRERRFTGVERSAELAATAPPLDEEHEEEIEYLPEEPAEAEGAEAVAAAPGAGAEPAGAEDATPVADEAEPVSEENSPGDDATPADEDAAPAADAADDKPSGA